MARPREKRRRFVCGINPDNGAGIHVGACTLSRGAWRGPAGHSRRKMLGSSLSIVNGVVTRPQRPSRLLGSVAMSLFFLTGCAAPSSPAATTPSATALTSAPASPASSPTPYAIATVFTSPLYKYSVKLPAGWTVVSAVTAWDGVSRIGHDDPIVDQLIGPEVQKRCKSVFVCGPISWVVAAPTTKSLVALARDQDAAEARDHDCSPKPDSQASVKIDGEMALVASVHCPAGGVLVLRAITIHEGVGYYFWLRDTDTSDPTPEPNDRADFSALIAAVRLPG